MKKVIIFLEIYEDKTFVFKSMIPKLEKEIKGELDAINSLYAALFLILAGVAEGQKEAKRLTQSGLV